MAWDQNTVCRRNAAISAVASGCRSWPGGATGGEKTTTTTDKVNNPQVLTLSRKGNRRQVMATAGESEGEGTRTLNHRIDSPVL